jgi:dockerin type I repeat protein
LTGNKDFCADFNRDGLVNDSDAIIMSPFYEQLGECASRFEGDANGDGAVSECDLNIWGAEQSNGTPIRPCACAEASGGGEMMFALSSGELAELDSQIPQSADMDGDGTVDGHDIAALDAAIYAAFDKMKTTKDAAAAVTSEAGPQPTFAEPQPEFAPTGGNDEPVPAPRAFPPGLPMPPDSVR